MSSAASDLTVGVLGGLGPDATLDFFARVLALTGARTDQEHLRLLIDDNPKVPNRNEAIAGAGPSAGPALMAMARGLETAGADFLVMACNTAHYYEADIRAAVRIPFVSIIAETMASLAAGQPDARRVGVLAAGGCRQARLYEKALVERAIEPIVTDDDEQRHFMELMYAIKAGDRGPAIKAGMRGIGEALIGRGADAVLAACTEVPLVLAAGDLTRPLVDSTAVLAQATVDYAKRRRALPEGSGPLRRAV
jgi:aspartate racemase